jgi:hypothetical protein
MQRRNWLFLFLTAGIVAAALTVAAIAVVVGSQQTAPQSTAVSALESHNNQNYSTANSAASQENTENPLSAPEEMEDVSREGTDVRYVVRSYEGKIAVFSNQQSSPVDMLDVTVDSLPEADQAALSEGIAAESKEALRRILEDYES